MVFQDPRAHINPVRTIGDFLDRGAAPGARRGRAPRPRRRAAALLDEVGIARRAALRQYPHELSGGCCSG